MGNRTAKVPLFGNVARAVTVNLDATAGAQVGLNLLGPDGQLVRWDQIANDAPSAPGAPSGTLNTTDDLQEGRFNFYFTAARASAAAPIQSVTGSAVNNADPRNPVITATGGSGIAALQAETDDFLLTNNHDFLLAD